LERINKREILDRGSAPISKQPNYEQRNCHEKHGGNEADCYVNGATIRHANQKAPPSYDSFHDSPFASAARLPFSAPLRLRQLHHAFAAGVAIGGSLSRSARTDPEGDAKAIQLRGSPTFRPRRQG
jgi:hypothetical protein